MNAQALGWDIHRKFSQVSLEEMNPQGQIHVVERARLEHDDREVLRAWLARLPKGTPVAMEAAYGWPWIADLLEGMELEPHLGHPPPSRSWPRRKARGTAWTPIGWPNSNSAASCRSPTSLHRRSACGGNACDIAWPFPDCARE